MIGQIMIINYTVDCSFTTTTTTIKLIKAQTTAIAKLSNLKVSENAETR